MRDKKNKTGKEEERRAKRSVDDWEEFAKRLKTNAEERAKGSKNPEERMDINQSHVAKEIGAVSMGESDVRLTSQCSSSSTVLGRSTKRSCTMTQFPESS